MNKNMKSVRTASISTYSRGLFHKQKANNQPLNKPSFTQGSTEHSISTSFTIQSNRVPPSLTVLSLTKHVMVSFSITGTVELN